jgi:hypothetical protein
LVKEDKEIQHVIGFSVSDVEELAIGPARYIRTFRIRTLLGDELVLTLRSENRLGLTLETDRPGPVVPRPRQRRRRDDRRSEGG